MNLFPRSQSLIGLAIALLLPATLTAGSPDSPLVFNLTIGPGLQQLDDGRRADRAIANHFIASFEIAAQRWSEVLFDPVTLNLTIDLDDGTLPDQFGAGAIPNYVAAHYSTELLPTLLADGKSLDDATSLHFLPAPLPTGFEFMTNDTSQVPAPRIRDNDGSTNNTTLLLTRGNAKALDLVPRRDSESDGSILFRRTLPGGLVWDFDATDGIGPRSVDFVGLAVHELGHQLGFLSGVDFVDAFTVDGIPPEGPLSDQLLDLDQYELFFPLDLFRYSADSLSQPNQPHGGLRDLSVGHPSPLGTPFFSIDGGATQSANHSSGQFNGDGFQAGHWQFDHDLGVMDPAAGFQQAATISSFDLQALDVIGWDVVAVPEPSGGIMLLVFWIVLLISCRTKSTSLVR